MCAGKKAPCAGGSGHIFSGTSEGQSVCVRSGFPKPVILRRVDPEEGQAAHTEYERLGTAVYGASVSRRDDHRVAMAVCGLFADGEMKTDDPECGCVSFPGFRLRD